MEVKAVVANLVRALKAAAGAVLLRVPDSILERGFPILIGYRDADVPAPPDPPDGSTRLYIGPVNSAGQGFAWARAAERLDGVGAMAMQFTTSGHLTYPADYEVPTVVFARSRRWADAQFEAVSREFTHVVFESQRSLFGRRFGFDVADESAALRERGTRVAMISHGSDIRLPSRHAAREPFSPFRDPDDALTKTLERSVAEHSRLLDGMQAIEFVSTPDLLVDREKASWLPVVIEPERWRSEAPLLAGPRPVVLHVPSKPRLKGTELLAGSLEELDAAAVIAYREPSGIPSADMPAYVARADVVIDQVAIGGYGVAACEAMAAGRLVMGHVSAQVRDHVFAVAGLPLPIIEATPLTLRDVLTDIAERPDHYRHLGREGQAFVDRVHDGRLSAEVLRGFLGQA